MVKKVSASEARAGRLRTNKAKGKAGEAEAVVLYNLSGYRMKRSPKGKDFVAEKVDPLDPQRVTETLNVEVKTGGARLSKRQRQTQAEEGLRVYRTGAFPWNLF